ncbi:MAG TPA: S4 domain-containing protein, partial [Patescibacteria group bacterium]|nr:S4 domain-containing protein [Patescibacteria group bacterium]
IEETPETMYAKLMAVGDELIATYFLLATNVSMEKVKEVEKRLKEGENPRDIKMELARVLVTELHGAKEADLAAEHFAKTVQRKELPDEIEEISVSQAFKEGRLIVDILLATNLSESRSDAKRLVQQGGVEVEGKRIDNPNEIINFTNGMIIKVGKRKFAKIKE